MRRGGNDKVGMGVRLQALIPGMQDREEADLGAEMARIARDREQRYHGPVFGGKVTCHLAPAMRGINTAAHSLWEEHMKRLLACVVLLLGSAGLAAADDWVGWLSDAKCATAAKAVSDGHADCAKKCVDGGEAIVLVIEADKKVYKLDSQDKAKPHLGKKVTVTGALDGETIKVEDIKT